MFENDHNTLLKCLQVKKFWNVNPTRQQRFLELFANTVLGRQPKKIMTTAEGLYIFPERLEIVFSILLGE